MSAQSVQCQLPTASLHAAERTASYYLHDALVTNKGEYQGLTGCVIVCGETNGKVRYSIAQCVDCPSSHMPCRPFLIPLLVSRQQ